jgi:WD40 repeat protein
MCVLQNKAELAFIEDHVPAVHVHSIRSGKEATRIRLKAVPLALEYVQSEDVLLAACADMTLNSISLEPLKRYQKSSSWPTPYAQMSLAWLESHRALYSGSTNGEIYSWNIEERTRKATLSGHTDIVMKVLSLKSLDNIASASLDTTVGVWDTYISRMVMKLEGHSKGVFSLSYDESSRILASSGFDHDVFIWSPFVNTLVYKLKGHRSSVVGCHCVEGKPELITADTSGVFKVWDVRTFQCVQTFGYASEQAETIESNSSLSCFVHVALRSPSLDPDHDEVKIFAATKRLYSFEQFRHVSENVTDCMALVWAGFSADLQTLVTVSTRNVKSWDAVLGCMRSQMHNHGNIEITACCFDSTRRKFIVGDALGRVRVYNCRNGGLMKSCPDDVGACVVSLSYTGMQRTFIAGYTNGVVRVYDERNIDSCRVLRTFDALNYHSELSLLAFSNNDMVVASAGSIGEEGVKLWDYGKGQCERTLYPCSGRAYVLSMTFLEDHPLLALGDSDGNISIWGSRGSRCFGVCLHCFVNQIPDNCLEERGDDVEEALSKQRPVFDLNYFAKQSRRTLSAAGVLHGLPMSYVEDSAELAQEDRNATGSSEARSERHIRLHTATPTILNPLPPPAVFSLSWDSENAVLYTAGR